MDIHLKNLVSPRRRKPQHNDLERFSVRYETSSPGSRLPIFIYQPLRKGRAELRRDDAALCLKAFPYAASVPGKPPAFGLRPHHGNGPVKLQTSRRLSSGELLLTTQDCQRTLEDLRGGEYIVARKHRPQRDSRSQFPRVMSPSATPATSQHKEFSPNPSRPSREVPRMSVSPSVISPKPLPRINGHPDSITHPPTLSHESAPHSPVRSDGIYHQFSQSTRQNVPQLQNNAGLGISSPSLGLSARTISEVPGSPSDTTHMNSLQALWKAEHSHLSAIYDQMGHELGDGSLLPPNFTGEGMQSHTFTESLPMQPTSHVIIDPYHHHRSSGQSQPETPSHESSSSEESSPKHRSLISSAAGSSSSDTNRTSLHNDPDAQILREEVHKRVDEMRQSYLRAIEARSSILVANQQTPHGKKPRRKRRSTQSSLRSNAQNFTGAQGSPCLRSTSGPQSPIVPSMFQSKDLPSPPTPRAEITPIAGVANLLFFDDVGTSTPECQRESMDRDLKRADSITLGTLMSCLDIQGSQIGHM